MLDYPKDAMPEISEDTKAYILESLRAHPNQQQVLDQGLNAAQLIQAIENGDAPGLQYLQDTVRFWNHCAEQEIA